MIRIAPAGTHARRPPVPVPSGPLLNRSLTPDGLCFRILRYRDVTFWIAYPIPDRNLPARRHPD